MIDGLTTNEAEQVKIVAQHFENVFWAENVQEIAKIPPVALDPPFSEKEVKAAIKSLKNNKSTGIDNLKAEQLKYGGSTIAAQIADISNQIETTENYPSEIKGVLTPLQKPRKAAGPPASLGPIIFLSTIQKP